MDVISLIRFVATLLITNSHFDNLYPTGYSFLSTGGMIGNALFFFCSGYTLYYSVCSKKYGSMKWLLKRLLRLYPSIWIFLLFTSFVLGKDYQWWEYIWPNYWFLRAIIVFYPLFYCVISFFRDKLIYVIGSIVIPFIVLFYCSPRIHSAISGSSYIIEDTHSVYLIHWWYLFAIMLFGAFIAKTGFKFNRNLLIKSFFITAIYYAYKGTLIYYKIWYGQLLLPVILFVLIAYYYSLAEHSYQRIFSNRRVRKIIVYISKLTLDIYIVQFAVIAYAEKYTFPVGLLIAIFLILIGAILLNLVAKKIINVLNYKLLNILD